jgi:hypothetical protein
MTPKNVQLVEHFDRVHDLDVNRDLSVNGFGIEAIQEIPDWFLRNLEDDRTAQDGKFAPDMIKVASIPMSVIETWHRQGFKITDPNNTPQDIMDRLRAEDMQKFITTSRRIK